MSSEQSSKSLQCTYNDHNDHNNKKQFLTFRRESDRYQTKAGQGRPSFFDFFSLLCLFFHLFFYYFFFLHHGLKVLFLVLHKHSHSLVRWWSLPIVVINTTPSTLHLHSLATLPCNTPQTSKQKEKKKKRKRSSIIHTGTPTPPQCHPLNIRHNPQLTWLHGSSQNTPSRPMGSYRRQNHWQSYQTPTISPGRHLHLPCPSSCRPIASGPMSTRSCPCSPHPGCRPNRSGGAPILS